MCPFKEFCSFSVHLGINVLVRSLCVFTWCKVSSLVEEMIFYLAKQILDVCSCYEVSSTYILPMFYIGT